MKKDRKFICFSLQSIVNCKHTAVLFIELKFGSWSFGQSIVTGNKLQIVLGAMKYQQQQNAKQNKASAEQSQAKKCGMQEFIRKI
jgi:hypothetical protein